ncbi:unnamed protein product [Linum tenue]|uniref:Uncharacterized protein n=1 Tax=Linum tenue TaxID=586396 RepID=A0AAV0NSI5_9ROSI|nr:unnamed protein product [Linum tenue]CAI0461620.1 unnamed protein product [Linum tenue]
MPRPTCSSESDRSRGIGGAGVWRVAKPSAVLRKPTMVAPRNPIDLRSEKGRRELAV